MEEIPGSEKFFPAQLVFLALGFLGPQQELLKSLDVKTDGRSNVATAPKVSYRPSSCSGPSTEDRLFIRNTPRINLAFSPLEIAIAASP